MNGVVSAGGALTAAAGVAMLKLGGNAVDAAVAATFASFVGEIGIVHWGGGGIAQLYDPISRQSVVYDFFVNMPGLGLESWPSVLDFHPTQIDFGGTKQDFWLGRASVAVPGNVIGLCQLAEQWGTLPLTTLLAPALDLIDNGFELPPFQARIIHLLWRMFTHSPSSRAIFQPNGRLVQAGDHLAIPDLHQSLILLGQEGAETFRHGALAQAILADQRQKHGLLTAEDLASYQVYTAPPLCVPYRGHELLLPPPCSIGGVLVAFTFRLLAHFDVAKDAPDSAEHYQLLYEVMAATNRAREAWEVQLNRDLEAMARFFEEHTLIDQYVAEIRQGIDEKRVGRDSAEPRTPNHTSHLSVIDGNGMAVTITTTAGESAGYVVPETGLILNNMLGEEDLNPYGWHQWQAGQRIPTMMTPIIVLKDGAVRLATGSGGSVRIRSALLQVVCNFVDYEMPVEKAVNWPRLHIENGVLQCEVGYDESAVATIESWGYAVNRWSNPSIYFGGAHSVARAEDGTLSGGGDARRDGHVAFS